MARSNPQTASASSATTTPPDPSRITKSRSERATTSRTMTRQKSRLLAEASSNGTLQTMVNEAQVVAGSSASASFSGKGKGKSRAVRMPAVQDSEKIADFVREDEQMEVEEDVCPVIDKDIKPFPIMDLPTEIRLEIYRACLTRPYNILLSKSEKHHCVPENAENPDQADQAGAEDSDDGSRNAGSGRPQRQAVRRNVANSMRAVASRGTRPIRLLTQRSAPGPSTSTTTSTPNGGGSTATNGGVVFRAATSSRPHRRNNDSRNRQVIPPGPPRPQNDDPLIANILRASKEIYKEARSVLYSENFFVLDLNTAMPTLACLHQRSRRQIKHVELEIPTYNEILERFQETVRLSLRYCSGLKKFVVHMPFTLPGADGSGTTGNTTVYANGFDILRWLPQDCDVILKGNICTEIETVVNKHLHLAKTLDKVRFGGLQYTPNQLL